MSRYIIGMLRPVMLLLLVGFFLLSHGTPPAMAQSDSASVYSTTRPGTGTLDWLLGRGRPGARVVTVNPRNRVYQPRRRSASVQRTQPNYRSAGSAHSTNDPAKRSLTPVNVAIIGDSLSMYLAQGLAETYVNTPSVTFIRRAREASGLIRQDIFDWPKQLRALIAASPKLDALVVEIGLNDLAPMTDTDGQHAPLSPRWRELYGKRVAEIIAIAQEKQIQLIWVGLPPLRTMERPGFDISTVNDIYKSRAAMAGAFYIDIWVAFSGEDGSYAVNGPGVDGNIVRLRAADGIHFTDAGSNKLAFFVDKELKKIIEAVQNNPSASSTAAQPASATDPALLAPQADTTTLRSLQPADPRDKNAVDSLLGVPVPGTPLPTTLIQRPLQGPVVSLTAIPKSANGTLIQQGQLSAPPNRQWDEGYASAKPGRTDDFGINR